ncbi:MAG: Hsp20/alpha crystallin family protein [Anaerolineales bacterium]|nr:Hsp20/alpha crystallin family protein [Anaerolineales bacterium]
MSRLIRVNPWREMVTMQNALDRMFDEVWRPNEGAVMSNYSLAIDVDETDAAYTIHADLPGIQENNIQIRLENDYLTIEAEIPEQVVEKKEAKALIRERRYGKFTRRIQLPQPIDGEHVVAEFENGVLSLTLPKVPEVQPKLIAVKAKNGKK